jgi:hypothetical protein
MTVRNNKIIKQNSPKNILWRLFRIGVEEEIVPEKVTESNKEFVEQLVMNTNEED